MTDKEIEKFIPFKDEFYMLDLDHSHSLTLRKVAERVYGRTYEAVRLTPYQDNHTIVEHTFDCAEYCEYEIEEGCGREELDAWINFEPRSDKKEPGSTEILADLIMKGHLPFGRYLVRMSY